MPHQAGAEKTLAHPGQVARYFFENLNNGIKNAEKELLCSVTDRGCVLPHTGHLPISSLPDCLAVGPIPKRKNIGDTSVFALFYNTP